MLVGRLLGGSERIRRLLLWRLIPSLLLRLRAEGLARLLLVALRLLLLATVVLIVLVALKMLRGAMLRLAPKFGTDRLPQLIKHRLPCCHCLVHHLPKAKCTSRFDAVPWRSIAWCSGLVRRRCRLLLVALRWSPLIWGDISPWWRQGAVLRHVSYESAVFGLSVEG